MNEQYIKCFESYEVSNLGNCRRCLKNGNYKKINCSIAKNGYMYFQIQRKINKCIIVDDQPHEVEKNKRINKYIHQMVCISFNGERPFKKIVDHIDRNKLNNNSNNLRWATYSENSLNRMPKLEILLEGLEI